MKLSHLEILHLSRKIIQQLERLTSRTVIEVQVQTLLGLCARGHCTVVAGLVHPFVLLETGS